jgi:hypothetical protein
MDNVQKPIVVFIYHHHRLLDLIYMILTTYEVFIRASDKHKYYNNYDCYFRLQTKNEIKQVSWSVVITVGFTLYLPHGI